MDGEDSWKCGLGSSSAVAESGCGERKVYVGDGQNWIWSFWEPYFKPLGFVAVWDFVLPCPIRI